MWLCAPLLLSVVSAFVFPAFAVLAVLLFCMKVSHVVHVQNCTYVNLCYDQGTQAHSNQLRMYMYMHVKGYRLQ